ncbi:MAG: type II toxin-antitoxin system RelE/ParE family toxin [Nanoarchaeota archaeon]|nr:type II toxin-antitoxin system RelE/ParE family toxin [Nanoarchaeota archaeon]MBU1027449.1 type II toxin-antitoxin system RelE/ParE family toxin [Nanoarchaeota archaeon]
MSFRILLAPKSQKFLDKLKNKEDKNRIEKKLKDLMINPELGKPLTGKLAGLWSLRFGKFRALYQIRKSELLVLILKLGHRKNVYD